MLSTNICISAGVSPWLMFLESTLPLNSFRRLIGSASSGLETGWVTSIKETEAISGMSPNRQADRAWSRTWRSCRHVREHAEFTFLTSNFGGQLTRRGGAARDITTFEQLEDGFGKLPRRHSSEPDCLTYIIGCSDGLFRGLLQGKGPFPAL